MFWENKPNIRLFDRFSNGPECPGMAGKWCVLCRQRPELVQGACRLHKLLSNLSQHTSHNAMELLWHLSSKRSGLDMCCQLGWRVCSRTYSLPHCLSETGVPLYSNGNKLRECFTLDMDTPITIVSDHPPTPRGYSWGYRTLDHPPTPSGLLLCC